MKWRGACVGLLGAAVSVGAAELVGRVSAPQGLIVSIYDSGYALCQELRTFELTRGVNVFEIADVPERLNPATLVLVNPGRGETPDLLDCGWRAAGTSPETARPRLRCRVDSRTEGPLRLRLLYGAEGLIWRANYVLLIREGEAVGALSVRAAVENKSGRDLENARVRLVETERGFFGAGDSPAGSTRGGTAEGLRYLYGDVEPQLERSAASPAYSRVFEVPRMVSVSEGATVYVTMLERANAPVSRFYVYDGVKLDRFEKNPRNDWNYGTAYHPLVDSYLEIGPLSSGDQSVILPRGRLMAAVVRADETADVLGYGLVRPSSGAEVIRAQMGPARGLRGARERVSYTEITPFREYEEAFSIRLENDSSEDVEIRVVEHLYRWPVYEIVKADTEYTRTAPQTIEFRPTVKAGGRRVVNYTVRYRW